MPLPEVHGLPLEPGHLLCSDSAKALESDTGKKSRTPSLILRDSGKGATSHEQEGAKLLRGDYLGLLLLTPLLPSLLDLSARIPRELAVLNGPPEEDREVPPVVVKGGRAHREGIEPLLQGLGSGIGGEEAEGLERELRTEEPLKPVPSIPGRVLLYVPGARSLVRLVKIELHLVPGGFRPEGGPYELSVVLDRIEEPRGLAGVRVPQGLQGIEGSGQVRKQGLQGLTPLADLGHHKHESSLCPLGDKVGLLSGLPVLPP